MKDLDFSLLSNRFYGEKKTRISLREFSEKALADPKFDGYLGNLRDGAIKDPDSLRNFKKELDANDIRKNWIPADRIRDTFANSG